MRVKILVIVAFLFIPTLGALARDGTEGGNGGDSFALEFSSYGKFISDTMDRYPEITEQFPEINISAFKAALKITKVESTSDRLILDGREVDAINYPARSYIRLNRLRWLDTKQSATAAASLALHEYLGILRINDSDYSISTRFILWVSKNAIVIPKAERIVRLGEYTLLSSWLLREPHDHQPKPKAIRNMQGDVIAKVSNGFWKVLQFPGGAARLADGRVIDYAGAVLNHGKREIRFLVCPADAPYGYGANGSKIVPFRSIILFSTLLSVGSTVYIPGAVGTVLPDGSIHDGYFSVVHVSSGINDRRGIDLFVGDDVNAGVFSHLEGKYIDAYLLQDK